MLGEHIFKATKVRAWVYIKFDMHIFAEKYTPLSILIMYKNNLPNVEKYYLQIKITY